MKHCSVWILLLLAGMCHAQPKQGQAYLDSLLNRVSSIRDDSDGVRLLNRIAKEYAYIDPEKGLKYATQELALTQRMGWQGGEAQAYNIIGVNHLNKGNYPAALANFFSAQKANENINDTLNQGLVFGNIGDVYFSLKEYKKAEDYYLKELNISKHQGYQEQIAYSLSNLGNNATGQNNFSEALEYYQKSLGIAKALNNNWLIMSNLGNIGASFLSLKNYNQALHYNFNALNLAQETGDKHIIANSLGNIGETYFFIAKDSLNPKPDSLIHSSKLDNLNQGITYLQKGIIASQEAQLLDGIKEFSGYLSEAYVLKGDYKNAFNAFKEFNKAKDSLFSIENNEKITNLETNRALELKDKDIKIAKLEIEKKQNERIYFLIGIALLLGILGILFRGFKKQQRSNHIISKEKQRSDNLLLNILPEEVAEELKETGISKARQFDNVSVLFTDFVNFTGIAELLSPQELVEELNVFFTEFDAIIERNGLEKIKTVGDAYIAVSGLPIDDPLHAWKCVNAAKDIMQFIDSRKSIQNSFQIRIGINSGPVVAGIVGVTKFAYDIWGDTVNTAARMEQNSEPGWINISQSTYLLVKDHFKCKYRGKIAAKNKGEIEMYFIELN